MDYHPSVSQIFSVTQCSKGCFCNAEDLPAKWWGDVCLICPICTVLSAHLLHPIITPFVHIPMQSRPSPVTAPLCLTVTSHCSEVRLSLCWKLLVMGWVLRTTAVVLSTITSQTLAKKKICRGKNLVTLVDTVWGSSPLRAIFLKEQIKPFFSHTLFEGTLLGPAAKQTYM